MIASGNSATAGGFRSDLPARPENWLFNMARNKERDRDTISVLSFLGWDTLVD